MRKEIPMLFSTPMVQAILAGRKTQTRRIIKPQPGWNEEVHFHDENEYSIVGPGGMSGPYKVRYKAGDIIWVREKWRKYCEVDENGYTQFDKLIVEFAADNPSMLPRVDADGFQMFNQDGSEKFIPWRPSIHLSKAAARIWLEVVEVSVQRLQDITREDSVAEGVAVPSDSPKPFQGYQHHRFPEENYKTLWEKINGDHSWTANPWVWVIKFKILSTTGKPQ